MARRRNSIANRFAKMRGLPPNEKALMQRIANLMDAALNNRQASNPFEKSTNRQNRQVYPPTGLLAQSGIASVKLIWDPANSNEHLRYEIEFLNLTTGASTTKTSYTNEIVFRGEVGTYLAKVASVGRDGSKSTLKQVEFEMGTDIMLIEGAKNEATELGTLVQDNIKLFKGFSVYTWGSVVLDKQTLDTNNQIVFRLWRAEVPDAVWGADPVTLQETVTLYAATESGSSLDTTARAGLISRPIAVRPGAFETSQSLMFSPIQVDDRDDRKTVTFFLQAINRDTEQDEVALSLTIWAGMDGVGSAVPGDTFEPRTPYVFPHHNSFHKQAPGDQDSFPWDRRDACAVVRDGFSLIGNKWTVAFWIRFDDLAAQNMFAPTDPNNSGNEGAKHFFTRSPIRLDNNATFNAWQFTVTSVSSGPGVFQHEIRLNVNWFDNQTGRLDGVTNIYRATTSGDRDQFSALFPWGDAIEASNSSFNVTNNGWVFMVICWSGGTFTGGVPKIRLYMNNAIDPNTGLPFIPPVMGLVTPTSDGSLQPCVQTDEQTLGYQFGLGGQTLSVGKHSDGAYNGDLNQTNITNAAYHQMGIWNVALDSNVNGPGTVIGPIDRLFNSGKGSEVDWKQPILLGILPFSNLNYIQNENLIHLIQFGAVEKQFSSLETLRDTGYFLPGGDMNFTQDVRENEYFENWHQTDHTVIDGEDRFHQRAVPFGSSDWFANFGQTWSRGTDIHDILSPEGLNGTTQYDWAFPGQNL